MPPENTDPVAKTQPAELDFEAAPTENPRIKKRSLKARAAMPPTQAAASPDAQRADAPRASLTPDQPRPTGYSSTAPAAAPSHTGYVRPGTPPGAARPQAAAPSGVLYYSNGPKDAAAKTTSPAPTASRPATVPTQPASQRPATTPMSTSSFTSRPGSTPQQNPNRPTGAAPGNGPSGHSTQQAPASRPAASAPSGSSASTGSTAGAPASRVVSTTVAGPASSSRPGGVSDFRANIERQSREQKSIGGILNFIVYGLIAIFICGAGLAAYGAHVIFRQLHAQSMTVSDLDSRYATANEQLNAQLKTTAQAVLELQAQVNRDETLALKQQDAIGKLQSTLNSEVETLHQERVSRATETSIRISENASLRARLRDIEAREQPNYRQ